MDKKGLLGREKGEREKGDERILGSGNFVTEALQKAGKSFEAQPGSRPPLEALIDTVSKAFGVPAEQLKSGSRRRPIVQARSVFACVAVRTHGYKGIEVAEALSNTAKPGHLLHIWLLRKQGIRQPMWQGFWVLNG